MNSVAQSLRPPIDRVRRSWRNSPLPGFFSWWGGELRALLPLSWRNALAHSARWYLLEYVDGDWRLRRAGDSLALAQWPDALEPAAQQLALREALREVAPQDLRLALCLPLAAVLRRRLQLPRAARDSLHQVAAYEMDRQTPFRLDQVHYGIRELALPAAAGRLTAELVVVPRPSLDAHLARLRELGVSVDAVDVAAGFDRLGADLLPPGLTPRRQDPRRRLNLALAALTVLLLVAGLNVWLHNRTVALATMQAQVDAMHVEAQQVAKLRQQWQDNAVAAGFLRRRKAAAPSVLAVLEELTARLPTDTWLERFTLDNTGRLGFQGQSAQAARLVDALRDAHLLSEPNFQGSIQRDPGTKKERFYLAAQLRVPASTPTRTPAPARPELAR
ncbi:MAG: type II secretion system protein GspL [Dyella sp.]